MHARYSSYSPPLDSPPLTPPHKHTHGHSRRPPPLLRRRRLLLIIPFLILTLCLSGFHLPRRKPIHQPSINHRNIIWSRYAYSLYATNQAYLCNAVMVFDSLHRFGSKADRILFYPDNWDTDIADGQDRNSQLLVKARDVYKVNLIPVDMKEYGHMIGTDVREEEEQRREAEEKELERKTKDKDKSTKKKKKKKAGGPGAMMKFLAWSRTEYDRILHLDVDITLNRHLDDLFLLPAAPVAMTRAYWHLPNSTSSSPSPACSVPLTPLLILLTPSDSTFTTLTTTAKSLPSSQTDPSTTILTTLFSTSALILPHLNLLLQSREFRHEDHTAYLSPLSSHHNEDQDEKGGRWNPSSALSSAAIIHFTDPPLPKPWIMHPHLLLPKVQPQCEYRVGEKVVTGRESGGILDNCDNKKVWTNLYDDFRRRRKDVCALLSAPAPDWWEGMDEQREGGEGSDKVGEKEEESEKEKEKGQEKEGEGKGGEVEKEGKSGKVEQEADTDAKLPSAEAEARVTMGGSMG